LALLTQWGSTMEDLVELAEAARSVRVRFTEGQFEVEVFDHQGHRHLYWGKDLPWLVHNIRDELLF
jgi:hypothetical protein